MIPHKVKFKLSQEQIKELDKAMLDSPIIYAVMVNIRNSVDPVSALVAGCIALSVHAKKLQTIAEDAMEVRRVSSFLIPTEYVPK